MRGPTRMAMGQREESPGSNWTACMKPYQQVSPQKTHTMRTRTCVSHLVEVETKREQVVDDYWPFSRPGCSPLQKRLAKSPSSHDAHHSGHVEKERYQPPVFIDIAVYKRREDHKQKDRTDRL
jgi:hypothetical protein